MEVKTGGLMGQLVSDSRQLCLVNVSLTGYNSGRFQV